MSVQQNNTGVRAISLPVLSSLNFTDKTFIAFQIPKMTVLDKEDSVHNVVFQSNINHVVWVF